MTRAGHWLAVLALLGAMSAASAADADGDGAQIYAAHCAVCHLPDLKGSPGFVPPLTGTLGNFAASADGRALLAAIVNWGMSGPISVGGRRYLGAMSLVHPLSDAEAAEVVNYVLREYNRDSLPAGFEPFTADEMRQYRARKATPAQVHAARQALVGKLEAAGKSR